MKRYTALILDIIDSRGYSPDHRNEIQYFMKSSLSALNIVFRHSLKLEVRFTSGDSLQGVFFEPQYAILYLRLFRMLLYPVGIRAGLGSGALNVVLTGSSDTNEQDGEVYHNARFAIENANEQMGYRTLYYSESSLDAYVNTVLSLCSALLNQRTPLQNKLALLIEILRPIDSRHVLDVNALGGLFACIYEKEHMHVFMPKPSKRRNWVHAEAFPMPSAPVGYPVVCDGADEDWFEKKGKVKGVSDSIAQMLGQSRQSIDKTIKTGKVNEERNATISLVRFLSVCEGATPWN